jgi:lipid-A-disaccharide synthase-like uncharacterized protein
MIPPIVIGILGSVLLISAWTYETIDSVRKHRALVDLRFAFIYITANFFLLSYSLIINDPVFIMLQAILISIVFSEIVFSIYITRKKHPSKR